MIEFSFIIPTYNNSLCDIDNCINSIIRQNISNYEILLINDGSTNKDIEKKYKNMNNKNIKYFYQENQGAAVARNTGLDHAKGKYIMFLDADDEMTDNFYTEFKKNENKNIDLIIFAYSNYTLEYEKINYLNTNDILIDNIDKILSNVLFTPGVYEDFMFGSLVAKIFKRELIEKNNIRFIPSLRKAQDRMFMLNIYSKLNSIEYLPIYSYKYKMNDKSICHTINYKMIDYYKKLYIEMKKFCEQEKLSMDVSKFLEYSIVSELLSLTVFHIDNKNGYFKRKKEFNQILDDYNFNKSIKKISIDDLNTFKRKIKYILFKYRLFLFLNIYYKLSENKRRKRSYNK